MSILSHPTPVIEGKNYAFAPARASTTSLSAVNPPTDGVFSQKPAVVLSCVLLLTGEKNGQKVSSAVKKCQVFASTGQRGCLLADWRWQAAGCHRTAAAGVGG